MVSYPNFVAFAEDSRTNSVATSHDEQRLAGSKQPRYSAPVYEIGGEGSFSDFTDVPREQADITYLPTHVSREC